MRKKSKEVKIKKAYIFLFLDKLIKKNQTSTIVNLSAIVN